MPGLDSPWLPIGLYFALGNRRKHRKFTGGLNERQLLAGGFGAASAEFLGVEASRMVGMEDTVTPQLGQALVGAAVSRWGGAIPQNKAIASGIHYNVLAQSFQDLGLDLGSLVDGQFGSGGSNGGDTSGFTESMPTRDAVSPTMTAGGVTF